MKHNIFTVVCILPVIYLAHGNEEETSLIQVRNGGDSTMTVSTGNMGFSSEPIHIMVAGGTPDSKTYLSATKTGGNVNLWMTDDTSGRQLWKLSPCQGCAQNEFNIKISGGITWGGFGFFESDRHFLSTTDTGSNVDLWKEDDGSGRQRWTITKCVDEGCTDGDHHIRIAHGVHKGWFDAGVRNYLSVGCGLNLLPGSCNVDMHHVDDKTGRQRWRFPGRAYHILISGGISPLGLGILKSNKAYLSVTDDGDKADLYSHDDKSGRQLWYITKCNDPGCEGRNLYHIRVFGGIDGGWFGTKTFLSVNRAGTHADLWYNDDGSGRQRWNIIDAGNNEFYIRVSGGVDNWLNWLTHIGDVGRLLSSTSDGKKLDLYSHDDDSGRQRWRIEGADGTLFTLGGGSGGSGGGGGGAEKQCAASCYSAKGNLKPSKQCDKTKCVGCCECTGTCAEVDGPPANLRCDDSCYTKKGNLNPSKQCAKSKCEGCCECIGTCLSDDLDDDERGNEISDVHQDEYGCANWCYKAKHQSKPWEKKCSWHGCSACPECAREEEEEKGEHVSKWDSCDDSACMGFCANHKHGPKPWKELPKKNPKGYKEHQLKCRWNCCSACKPCHDPHWIDK